MSTGPAATARVGRTVSLAFVSSSSLVRQRRRLGRRRIRHDHPSRINIPCTNRSPDVTIYLLYVYVIILTFTRWHSHVLLTTPTYSYYPCLLAYLLNFALDRRGYRFDCM